VAFVTISGDQMPFEVGAQILGVLAFPGDIGRARAAANAWCAELVQANIEAFADTADEVRADYPHYASMFRWEIRRQLRSAKTQLRNRAVAARMSRGFFFENVYSRPPELPEGMRTLSLNQLSILVQRESGQSDPENTEKRIWRTSRSIIHLAAAFDREIGSRAVNDNDLRIDDHELMNRVLKRAEWHEQIVVKDPRFGISTDDLVRVRVV
jgi:hypothetical protein